MNRTQIDDAIRESIRVKELIAADGQLLSTLETIGEKCCDALRKGHRVLFCGNGGSAADAQHLAAELSGRFRYDRPPLAGESLTVNTSFITAVSNDYSFDDIFARMLESSGKPGDVLIGLTTSGNSENVVRAFRKAAGMSVFTVAFTGASGGTIAGIADLVIRVPSDDTPRIQESHILLGHILCEFIESKIFPR
jgi:D-sedoheptulose 7-phosphate isomerase